MGQESDNVGHIACSFTVCRTLLASRKEARLEMDDFPLFFIQTTFYILSITFLDLGMSVRNGRADGTSAGCRGFLLKRKKPPQHVEARKVLGVYHSINPSDRDKIQPGRASIISPRDFLSFVLR